MLIAASHIVFLLLRFDCQALTTGAGERTPAAVSIRMNFVQMPRQRSRKEESSTTVAKLPTACS